MCVILSKVKKNMAYYYIIVILHSYIGISVVYKCLHNWEKDEVT